MLLFWFFKLKLQDLHYQVILLLPKKKKSHRCPILSSHRNKSPPVAACKFQQYCSILLHLPSDQEKPEAYYFRKTCVLCLPTTQQGDVMAFTDVVSRHCHTNMCTHLLHPLPQAGLGLPEDRKCCTQQPNTPKQKLRYAALYRWGVEAKSISYSQSPHLTCSI